MLTITVPILSGNICATKTYDAVVNELAPIASIPRTRKQRVVNS